MPAGGIWGRMRSTALIGETKLTVMGEREWRAGDTLIMGTSKKMYAVPWGGTEFGTQIGAEIGADFSAETAETESF